MRQVDHPAASSKGALGRGAAEIVVGAERGPRRGQALYLDALKGEQVDHLAGAFRIAARLDHDAADPGGDRERRGVEVVEVVEPRLAIGGQRAEGRHRGDEVVRDAVTEGGDRAVVLPERELRTTIGLEGHPGGAKERGPRVPVAGVVEVEDVAHEVRPILAVEGIGIALAERLEPLHGGERHQLVDRRGGRREEVLRRRAVQVDEHLRMPTAHGAGGRLRLGLRQRDQVAIHVEAIVIEASLDAPRLASLERGRLLAADGNRIAPRRETLVAIGVL